MSGTFVVNLVKPVKSVKVLDSCRCSAGTSFINGVNPTTDTIQVKLREELNAQVNLYADACRTLQSLLDKLNQFYDEIFAGHKEEIAKFSIEIARKILTQKITDGDYKIESIVQEAIKNAPTRQDLTVYLNPKDIAVCQKIQQDNTNGIMAGIKFVADPNIGRAECVLESPKGIVKSLIDEHLEHIGNALQRIE